MAKYIPKADDPVFLDGQGFVRYVIVGVNADKQTADVRTVSGIIVLTRDVPWSKIHRLDSSQNALRIVDEATRDK
jgi:hypothetical protein